MNRMHNCATIFGIFHAHIANNKTNQFEFNEFAMFVFCHFFYLLMTSLGHLSTSARKRRKKGQFNEWEIFLTSLHSDADFLSPIFFLFLQYLKTLHSYGNFDILLLFCAVRNVGCTIGKFAQPSTQKYHVFVFKPCDILWTHFFFNCL